jgi:2-polyprenyl-3-methyl-5-hydroxy-6-metoxy-1,4-benzoquinol methylase
MTPAGAFDLYRGYGRFKGYAPPRLDDKLVRRFDREFLALSGATPEMTVLEIGCGTGLFLSYLARRGFRDFLGIDRDPELLPHVPDSLRPRFRAVAAEEFLAAGAEGRSFDCVVMNDVLEHLSYEEGIRLLAALAPFLAPAARVMVKVPNAGSPWGARYQWGDITHRAAYTPTSMRQLALAAGYVCVRCYAYEEGSPARRLFDRLLHGALSRLLMTPPELWSANFFARLEREDASGG